jgi:glyoxylase-like metal-dependent hydrolase (beta-lactamase superfamily II)
MQSKAVVKSFFDEATNSISHLVIDPATREAAIIDPVLDFEPRAARIATRSADAILAAAAAEGARVRWMLETHCHADHLTAAQHVAAKTGAPIVIGAEIATVQRLFKPMYNATDVVPDGSVFDRLVREGERLPLGDIEIAVMATPGHTPACVTYLIGDAAFVGDTLFMPDYGTARTDFPGGDAALLYRSIQRLLALPAETRIFLCHDYLPEGRRAYSMETNVAAERDNVHLRAAPSEAAFAAFRRERDKHLAVPLLLLPAIQVNIRAGRLPPAEADGQSYLKLPIDRL